MISVDEIDLFLKQIRYWKEKDEEPITLNKGDYELMQFTGLKDKNGKEIYIGDILIWDKDEEDECTIIIKLKDELGIYYELLKQKDKNIVAFDIRFYRSEESAEIIGNKFENPELLK